MVQVMAERECSFMQSSDTQTTINRIIAIERRARQLVTDAETERQAMPAQVKEALAREREAAMTEADACLAREAEAAKQNNARVMAETERKYEARTAALDAAFTQNRADWVETIFRQCIDTRA